MKLTYRPCPACGTTYPLPDRAQHCYWCRNGYAAGLDAAREAIAALDIGRDVRFSVDVRDDALAAIDALKEKP